MLRQSSARQLKSLSSSLSYNSFICKRTLFGKANKDAETLKRLKKIEEKGFESVLAELKHVRAEERRIREEILHNRTWLDYAKPAKPQFKVTGMIIILGLAVYLANSAKENLKKEEEYETKYLNKLTDELEDVKTRQIIYAADVRTRIVALLSQKMNFTNQQKDEIEKEVATIISTSNAPEKPKIQGEEVFY